MHSTPPVVLPPSLDAHALTRGTTSSIVVRGVLDLPVAADLAPVVGAALRDAPEILVLDLGELDFLDSAGVHAIGHAHRHAEARGARVVILPAPPRVHEVFVLCGIADELPFVSGGAAPGE